jgi:HEAT repeat protein
VDLLAGLLEDPDGEVRFEAVRALGRTGGDRAAGILRGFLDGSGALQREALDALSRTGSMIAVRILETMETPDAIEGLGRLGRRGIPGLLRALDHEDTYLRWKAVEILRWMTGQRFGYHHDGDERDRKAARDRWHAWWKKESKP